MRRYVALATTAMALLLACKSREGNPVEDLGGGRDVSRYLLTSLAGTRDGDRLHAIAMFGDGKGEPIRVDLRFSIGSPTRLASGTWKGLGSEGAVRERSLTFLGGQSGSPSIGGRFDLVGPDSVPRYRVSIPLQELKSKL